MAGIIRQVDQSHLENEPGFCIDTSALIKLDPYYTDIFPSLWESLDGLVNDGRLIAPYEVFIEIHDKYPDDWIRWANRHRKMFIEKKEIVPKARQIQNWYPGLTNKTGTKTDADYFVIALAQYMGKKWTVVTDESKRKTSIKIPHVCNKMNIPCVNVHNFFKKLDLKY